jgi:hypothetical protein
MSYDLQAEGMNGVQSETTVVALPGFTSEFNISVWNVDATAAPVIDAIHGITTGGAIGVYGQSNADGVGVRGEVTSGTGDGVQGQGSGSFSGVAGFGGNVSGGEAPGTGVFGLGGTATDNSVPGAPGVRGIGGGGPNTTDPLGRAVGVYGQGGPGGPGVVGSSLGNEFAAPGVAGFGTGGSFGVGGVGGVTTVGSTVFDGHGVEGLGGGTTGLGVAGYGAGAIRNIPSIPVGVFGQAGPGADGVEGVGSGTEGAGVHGISLDSEGNGVIGEADNGSNAFGIWGRSSSGFAGFFQGAVLVSGSLTVTGAKSAAVPFNDGSHRRLYCIESPESWLEDFGVGQLVNGQAQVQLDAGFAAIVKSESYHVFVTEYEDNNALYVVNRTSAGFGVRAKLSNTANSLFSYRIVAKRKDIEGQRLEPVKIPTGKLKPAKPTFTTLPPIKPTRPLP